MGGVRAGGGGGLEAGGQVRVHSRDPTILNNKDEGETQWESLRKSEGK